MCWPRPVRSRCASAARIAVAAYMPVRMSVMATPTFIGSPSGSPVMLINPPIAWTRKSYPALSRYGPVWPNPVIEQYTRRGLSRSEEHTSELQSQSNLACRLLLENKRLVGVRPIATSRFNWALAGALSAVAGVLVAPILAVNIGTYAYLLVTAVGETLIARLFSFP